MTFEEFFKRKRIDLAALQSGEPGLYSEFEKHFNQMGEKSFDHTKKYWFNKLRLLYHLAPELKPERVHIENRLAEQTITESLLEEKIPSPSVGFKPRFKAGMAGKPSDNTSDVKDPAQKDSATITPEVNEAASKGDQDPLFEQEKSAMQAKADSMPRSTDSEPVEKAPDSPATKPAGFKPRFNAGMVKPKAVEQTNEVEPEKPKEVESEKFKGESAEQATPKPAGVKPRVNMKMVLPKTEDAVIEEKEEVPEKSATETTAEVPAADKPAETPASKPAGFKPRFNARMMKPKPPEEEN